jgi:hypothetical protein
MFDGDPDISVAEMSPWFSVRTEQGQVLLQQSVSP